MRSSIGSASYLRSALNIWKANMPTGDHRPNVKSHSTNESLTLGFPFWKRHAKWRGPGLSEGFPGHSGRVGMARDLVKSGVELPALMTAGRWKSSRMSARYTERQAAGRSAVARYYQEGGVKPICTSLFLSYPLSRPETLGL